MSNLADAIRERRENSGLYAAPSGAEGIFLSGIRALVREAIRPPALAQRRVVVIGDAEQMSRQEGQEEAANAFLKLLEEPPAHLTLVLTSSEPGALLPTIRSRVVMARASRLADADVRALISRPEVAAALDKIQPESLDQRVQRASGSVGALLSLSGRSAARDNAARLLAATHGTRADQMRVAFGQGASGARGAFTDTLDELTYLLRNRAEGVLADGNATEALRLARGIPAVERAKTRAAGNAHPGLLTARLVRELTGVA